MMTKFVSCLALAGVLFTTSTLLGQSGGTIQRSVSDPSGGAVPNATVLLKSIATGATRSATTDERGFYIAPNLNPAEYEISFAAPGFSTEVQKGLVLTVGGELTANAHMKM